MKDKDKDKDYSYYGAYVNYYMLLYINPWAFANMDISSIKKFLKES